MGVAASLAPEPRAPLLSGRLGLAGFAAEAERFYRPRHPESTSFYQLLEEHFERYVQVHEERFEPASGRLQPVVRTAVEAFLACGRPEGGFARVRCPACKAERLLAFSCRTRNFCPSCQAKRAAAFAEKLVEEILASVPHRHYVFTIPRALRGVFQRDRRLLDLLARCAYDAVYRSFQELYGRKDVRPGCVLSLQTLGSYAANFHPHVHALITEGVFTSQGDFLPLASLDTSAIEEVFRRLVLRRLREAERLSDGFLERLLAWSPSGFSVHAQQVAGPQDRSQLERLARYIPRAPMRLDSLEPLDEGGLRVRTPPDPRTGATHRMLDVLDWVHAVTSQIPDPRQHLVRYFGAYSCRRRTAPRPPSRDQTASQRADQVAQAPCDDSTRASPARRASWARLIRRIFEVDPLLCCCGATMVIVSLITEPRVIDRILRHLRAKGDTAGQRGPPPIA